MGAAGSSNSAPPPPSAPLRSRSEETFIYGTEESCCPEYTNENIRQRTRTSAFDVGEEPRSQDPSSHATVRGEEWWSQRPSAPSLSNLRSSHPETLLTYAARMTGWQSAEGHGPSSFLQNHQESMELTRVITQLAMANQQLATAHTATLAHLEELYKELRKERESRRRGVTSIAVSDGTAKTRLTMEQEDEDENRRKIEQEDEDQIRRRMELRIDRLEDLLAWNRDGCQGGQRIRDEVKKPRSRIDRFELMERTRGPKKTDEQQGSGSVCSMENQDLRTDRHTCYVDVVHDRVRNRTDVPESVLKNQSFVEPTDDEGRTGSIHRTRSVDETAVSKSSDETDRSAGNLHLEMSESQGSRVEDGRMESSRVNMLSEEIERLKAERLEYRGLNDKLTGELDEQKEVVKRLTENYQESKTRQEEMESSFRENKEEYEKLTARLEVATKETERLLKEIDAFNAEKDSAEARINSLEQDLQKSLSEKEEIKNIESKKILELETQLSEEVADKKKQIKALEDALNEIQRLKKTVKTEEKSGDDHTTKENIGPSDSTNDRQECPPMNRTTNIEELKKELTLKREARQRAIAAVSSEMERLRRELDAEKEAHSETSRVLDLLRSAQNDAQTHEQGSEADGSFKRSRSRDPKPDEHELAMKRVEAQRLTSILKVSDELRNDIRFQIEKVDDLRYHLETEPDQHRYRIRCLADVTNRTREALHARERRVNDLKDHLAQILVRLGDRSFLDHTDEVGLECERQLENINSLKSLYNERLKVLTELKDGAIKELVDVKERLDHSLKQSECLEDDLRKADDKIDAQDTEISNLESQLGLTKADCRDLQNQMSLINGLFTQILLGASSADMDLDRLTQLLQENHDLISDMAREESTEAAALPKLLLDLVEQVEGGKGSPKRAETESGTENETDKKEEDLQQEEIAHNLPKVWRVLLELLSCHAEGAQTASVAMCSDPNSCYKSVDTPAGPRLVISVSKTYIRLKELILEKKHLEKEMNRMKQLNCHLESKLGEQEKRLSAVSAELSKTWTIVDRMQAQHQQLHTHEKILRYELQQKRKMLQELKQELEYCREKWESARQKNTNTELQWRSLRREFAARKALAVHDSFSNSAESGFSDERGDDTDEEEDNSVEERIRLGPRRRPRKESPRVPSPDTESEQPTDTELSEPKTSSSTTLEQRTPTPETEAELEDAEVAETAMNAESEDQLIDISQESLDPLDQALTNVIQNLIGINDSNATSLVFENEIDESTVTENPLNDSLATSFAMNATIEHSAPMETSESLKVTHDNSEGYLRPEVLLPADQLITTEDSEKTTDMDGEKVKNEEPSDSSVTDVPTVTSPISTQPVFSIGPFPSSAMTLTIMKNVQFSDPLIVGPSNPFSAPVFGSSQSDVDGHIEIVSFSSSFDSSTSVSPTCHDGGEPKSLEKRGARSTESIVDSDSLSVDSSSSLETVKEFPTTDPPPSTSPVEEERTKNAEAPVKEEAKAAVKARTPEEALAAREERLKRLEEQAKWLMNKMNATSRRGSALSTRLEELHEAYGEPPAPPPMPDVLPSRRLRTNFTDLPRQVPESSGSVGTENMRKTVPSNDSNEAPSDSAP
ncbi:PREDICTED: centrosomal protein of 128 kDa isoform X1 [Dufourea novaeangliae]|uniref:centrosomal protein of 128 kDa isoform X1 n=2 Tax=Dufourea novaeangliae TaxID=178035 RepID=UPI000767DA5C|nr:PREDICTED: centrosomal protein of 128 kDa isoform X1 [Dufourea novaeangliae]